MAAIEPGRAAARAADDLYRRHGGEVYRYAFAVLGNHADAEDVTQTTFLNAYRSLEQGVRPRKPSNWLLVIAGNAIKQRFRQQDARPHEVALDDRVEGPSPDDTGPTVGEVLAALAVIPPYQRQALVLREFEGRSYKEIAEILGVTTSALETLLFRARRSLAEELEHQITCTDAQFAISQATDGRVARKERRRLRRHVDECPDCARFARLQQRQRRALRGLALVPVPVSFTLMRSLEGSANAATLPVLGTGASASVAAAGAAGGGAFVGGVAVKAAAVVAAASVAGGVGVVGAAEVDHKDRGKAPVRAEKPGERLGQVARTGAVVPGRGVAIGRKSQSERPGRRVGQASAPPARGHAPGFTRTKDARPAPPVGVREAPRGRAVAGGWSKGGRPEARKPMPARSSRASAGQTTPGPATQPTGRSHRGKLGAEARQTPLFPARAPTGRRLRDRL
jgi:RNA polymerase sigma factor (sigma-70 family)